ncbi:MAG: polysaccharide deacetylase family protein [Spirochaetia bacterium]|nr:polysaccharide deacetylase family protein [Spirochaetia bacterium]
MRKIKILIFFLLSFYVSLSILSNNIYELKKETKRLNLLSKVYNKNFTYTDIYGIPVICYHHIVSDNWESKEKNIFHLTKNQFQMQINWLKENGYATITLNEFNKYLNKESVKLPEKPILITFDDGRKNFFTNAKPVLDSAQYKAVLFIYPNPININHDSFLTWQQIQTLYNEGHDIQSHTYTHPLLDRMSLSSQSKEFQLSKKTIEQKLNSNVQWLAYPFGAYNADTKNELKKADYEGAFTVFSGSNFPGEDKYSLKRILITSNLSISNLKNKIMTSNLSFLSIEPEEGSNIYDKKVIRVKLEKNLEFNNLRVEAGSDFVYNNLPAFFNYNKNTGDLTVLLSRPKKSRVVLTVFYKNIDGLVSQNTILYSSFKPPFIS